MKKKNPNPRVIVIFDQNNFWWGNLTWDPSIANKRIKVTHLTQLKLQFLVGEILSGG